MPPKKTLTQQEKFTRNIFNGMSQRAAYIDAWPSSKTNSIVVVDAKASRLARSAKVEARLEELRKRAEDASIATAIEIQQALTEVIRGRLADFLINPTPEKLRSAALQEMTIIEAPDGTKRTRVKLHDLHKAADILSKMKGLYTDGANVYQDNRQIHIHTTERGEKLTQWLLDGGASE